MKDLGREFEKLRLEMKDVEDIIRRQSKAKSDTVKGNTEPIPEPAPCPFCGSKNIKVKGDSEFVVGVECDDCHAMMVGFVGKGATFKEIVEKWNRRSK